MNADGNSQKVASIGQPYANDVQVLDQKVVSDASSTIDVVSGPRRHMFDSVTYMNQISQPMPSRK